MLSTTNQVIYPFKHWEQVFPRWLLMQHPSVAGGKSFGGFSTDVIFSELRLFCCFSKLNHRSKIFQCFDDQLGLDSLLKSPFVENKLYINRLAE